MRRFFVPNCAPFRMLWNILHHGTHGVSSAFPLRLRARCAGTKTPQTVPGRGERPRASAAAEARTASSSRSRKR